MIFAGVRALSAEPGPNHFILPRTSSFQHSPNFSQLSQLSPPVFICLNSPQVDKYRCCKMSIRVAKFSIVIACATSKVYKVSPLPTTQAIQTPTLPPPDLRRPTRVTPGQTPPNGTVCAADIGAVKVSTGPPRESAPDRKTLQSTQLDDLKLLQLIAMVPVWSRLTELRARLTWYSCRRTDCVLGPSPYLPRLQPGRSYGLRRHGTHVELPTATTGGSAPCPRTDSRTDRRRHGPEQVRI